MAAAISEVETTGPSGLDLLSQDRRTAAIIHIGETYGNIYEPERPFALKNMFIPVIAGAALNLFHDLREADIPTLLEGFCGVASAKTGIPPGQIGFEVGRLTQQAIDEYIAWKTQENEQKTVAGDPLSGAVNKLRELICGLI